MAEIPNAFQCPISFELMQRPVRLLETGMVYDESSIADWFALGKMTCPSTGQTIKSLEYVPEEDLAARIEQWTFDHPSTETIENDVPIVQPSRAKIRRFMTAAKNGRLDVIQEMLQNGMNVFATDSRYHKFTALHYAAQLNHVKVIEYLIASGIDVNQKDDMGLTALHIAAHYQRKDALKLLLLKGANPNLQDAAGTTALHLAARQGKKSIIRILLENDADKRIQDFGGFTAKDKAGLWGRLIVRRMLK